MRLHGDREPRQPQYGMTGGATCCSGAANEVWSYGEKVLAICEKYLALRERLRPYITELMQEAHEKGTPIMRPLFYEFPEDMNCWRVEDEYMFGSRYLIAPIMSAGVASRKIYLPNGGHWTGMETGESYQGGRTYEVKVELETMPVFVRQF